MENPPPPARPLDPAVSKVINLMGRERGMAIVDDVMRHANLRELSTPDDRYAFACVLMKRGGIFEVVGRAIKIQAILHGASER
jgi:hypothetical protein